MLHIKSILSDIARMWSIESFAAEVKLNIELIIPHILHWLKLSLYKERHSCSLLHYLTPDIFLVGYDKLETHIFTI